MEKDSDWYSDKEAAERRDAALKRAMNMPPKLNASLSGKPKKTVKASSRPAKTK